MQANFSGLAGAAMGGAVGWGIGHLLASNGLPQVDSAACGTIAGCFTASMFGLLYDRSVVPEFRRSYRVLTSHIVPQTRFGPDYDPRERLAFFGIPIAFATVVLPVLAIFLWLAKQDPVWVGMYVVAGILSVAATFIIGNMTAESRLLQREIAFNVAPAVAGAFAQPAVAAAPPQMRAPSPARARMQALFTIAGGFLLLAINHWEVVNDHRYYVKLLYGGPMIIMVAIFALFEPRIMSRHLPIGKTYPKSVLLLMLLAMAIGAAAGFQLEQWYRGGY